MGSGDIGDGGQQRYDNDEMSSDDGSSEGDDDIFDDFDVRDGRLVINEVDHEECLMVCHLNAWLPRYYYVLINFIYSFESGTDSI